jgi:hypothetical protein
MAVLEEASMSPAIDMSAFDRATEPLVRVFSLEQARQIVEYRGDEALQSRIEELAAKSNEGELRPEERAEYAAYVQANKFVAILQAQARKRIDAGRS